MRVLGEDDAGPHTQLTFAGPLALCLIPRTSRLGATPLSQRRVALRAIARNAATRAARPISPHLLDPAQPELFAMDRDWTAVRDLRAFNLPLLTERAEALLAEFVRLEKASSVRGAPTGTAVLRTVLAWLGADAPIRERDVRALAATKPRSSLRRVLTFLHRRGLLDPDALEPLTPAGSREDVLACRTAVPDLAEQRRNQHHERAIVGKVASLPESMAEQVLAWSV